MATYRVTLELRSALATPLAADTLWGHIAWGIRYRQGEAALLRWLAGYEHGEPPLVISDPLPAGFFPRPQLPPPFPARQVSRSEAAKRKSLAKVAWIDASTWTRVADNLSPESLQKALADTSQPGSLVEMAVTRAGINRLSQSTMQPGGAALFTEQQLYPDVSSPPRFDVWTISPEDPATVERWFRDGLLGGYGRDASAGLGWLEVLGISRTELPQVAHANAGILLAPTVPRRTDPARGFLRLGVRCGRLGGDFSVFGPTDLEPGQPWLRQKRPVFCLVPGSVLVFGQRVARWVGRTVTHVHPQLPTIRHYGMSPVLPCRLADHVLEHRFLREQGEFPAPTQLSASEAAL